MKRLTNQRVALRAGEFVFALSLLLFGSVLKAQAADLTWMAQEQNCKQFIRKFQAELGGESGIRDLPETEQREAKSALRKACTGPIGRCQFSFCAIESEVPVLLNPPISKVDIGKLLEGEEVEGAQAVDNPGFEKRPQPKLPADRMVAVGERKGEKNAQSPSASSRERHPLYDPRQRRLLDELEAEDAAESKRQAEMRAAEERMKEELLSELGRQDASEQVGLSLEIPALATVPRTAPTATPTPDGIETLPPPDATRIPASPWSRAGTFPRTPISHQVSGAAPPELLTAEQLAHVAEEARRVRLEWLKADMSCQDLLGEIKRRYSDVRPANGFSKEVKLDLWEVLNTACSQRFATCNFPQCVKLQKLTQQTEAMRAAADEAKALAHEALATAARSDLDAEVSAKESFTSSLIREAEQREKQEKRSWQKFQMQSEISDRTRPTAEAKPETATAKAPKATPNKAQYDPTVYADPRDLDRKPRGPGTVRGKTTSEQRVKASQTPPVPPKRSIPAAGSPPPGRIF